MADPLKLRILMVHNGYKIRGGEDISAEMETQVLREAGHHVDYVTAENDDIQTTRDMARTAASAIWSRAWHRKVSNMLAVGGYDILHAQNLFPLISPSIYYAARRHGVPVVQAVRNYRLACPSATILREGKVCTDCIGRRIKLPSVRHRCYRGSAVGTAAVGAISGWHGAVGTWRDKVDCYLAVSNTVADVLAQEGFPPDRIMVKPDFTYRVGTAHLRPPKRSHVLFVGRLSPEKGLPLLFDAWSRVHSDLPLRVVGEGRMPANVPKGVELVGKKPLEGVLEEMRDAVCVVMPGSWPEPFGRVAVEAFSQGTPVIASDSGGVADTVQSGRNGALFKTGDAYDLATQLSHLLQDTDARHRCEAGAMASYTDRFTPEANLTYLEQAYDRAKTVAGAPLSRVS
ncbi:MAG: glycosyltransferase family 4 protein [Paracoccaceae bacterium]